MDSKYADVVAEATVTLLTYYLEKTLTITADNGKEFADLKLSLKNWMQLFILPIFIIRGSEDTNGLIRHYFTNTHTGH